MDKAQRQVLNFHINFDVPYMPYPSLPTQGRCNLRIELIDEEFTELKEAFAKRDLTAVADALADLRYVINGAALECGIDLDVVGDEVHRSNMTKIWPDGTVHYREDGKVLKPPTYSPANIRNALRIQKPIDPEGKWSFDHLPEGSH